MTNLFACLCARLDQPPGSPVLPTVIFSGCHAGPNPSPGLGIARSLRLAFPEARLVGRDFSPAASGLHDPIWDEVWLCPPWDEMDLAVHRVQLHARLADAWLISGLDVEVQWLASLEHPRILGPPTAAIRSVAKPEIQAAASLPLARPAWERLSAGDLALHRFCRRHNWRVWIKGPAHEAAFIATWPDLRDRATRLAATWGADGLFVEAHVAGVEVSLAFAAFQGELLGEVLLQKQLVTEQGKAWGGTFAPAPADLEEALRGVVRELGWTGGGELECVRDGAGKLWLIDWNPRFPAWIHGATLAGENLPGALLARATGLTAQPTPRRSSGFVRVVVEVPLRAGLALPQASPIEVPDVPAAKHPSGMPQLMKRLSADARAASSRPAESLTSDMVTDLTDAAARIGETPARVLLPRTAQRRFAQAAVLRKRHGFHVAYSVKTNPDASLMALARRHGLWAETISKAEVGWALECGWPPRQIVYNGPVAVDRKAAADEVLAAAFADDLQAFAEYARLGVARVAGLRLRPPFLSSRFGVPLDDPDAFGAAVAAFAAAPRGQDLGVSFHAASSEIGGDRWVAMARSVIDFAAALTVLSGRQLGLLDLGGGWTAEDFDDLAEQVLPDHLASEITARLGNGTRLVLEPGKALAEPAQALLSRVVAIRSRGEGRREVVLDVGINHVPQIHQHPHRLALIRSGKVVELGPGVDVLLGPLCMEGDWLAEGVGLPADLAVGDLVAICDAGAYDASTAYVFGRGAGEGIVHAG